MFRLFLLDIKRMIKAPQIYISILIMIISTIVTYQDNYFYYNLYNIKNIGAINLFIYGNIINSLVLVILAPIVAVLPYCDCLLEDYKSGFIKNVITRIGSKKYYCSRIIFAASIGGLIFCIFFFLELGIFAILDQSPSVMISPPNGIFGGIYGYSMFQFCLVFIFHCFIFGFVFALFGCALALNIRNKLLIYIIPIVLYYLSSTFGQFIPSRIIPDFLYYIMPYYTFAIYESMVPGYQHISQLAVLSFVSILLIILGINKRKSGFNL